MRCLLIVGINDKLYFPYSEIVDNCFGYWIATDWGASYLNILMYSGSSGSAHFFQGHAVRPVVCLSSSATGTPTTQNGVTTWTIE